MSSTAPPLMSEEQPGSQQQQPAPNPGAQQQQQGLPPTGLQQQLASLNSYYSQVQNARTQGIGGGAIGFDPRQQQFAQAQAAGGGELPQQTGEIGSTSLDAMARNLAQRYGMPIGRGRLVDEYGNFLMTPQQVADASGGAVTLGEAAAQMNYIGQAIARRQNEEQQQKGMAALQAGLGQVQSRGRGSLASMMSGYYQDIADLYANQEYEAADFSYFIQKEQQDIARELERRAEKRARRGARMQFAAGIAMMFTGNYGAGIAMTAGSAEGTGWFG